MTNDKFFYQTNTTNESFTLTNIKLRKERMENPDIIFRLDTKSLLINDIKNLLASEITKLSKDILVECNFNIWYYLREICRICTDEQMYHHIFNNGVQYLLIPEMVPIIECYDKGYSIVIDITNKPKTMISIITQTVAALSVYHYNFRSIELLHIDTSISTKDYMDLYWNIFKAALGINYITTNLDLISAFNNDINDIEKLPFKSGTLDDSTTLFVSSVETVGMLLDDIRHVKNNQFIIILQDNYCELNNAFDFIAEKIFINNASIGTIEKLPNNKNGNDKIYYFS